MMESEELRLGTSSSFDILFEYEGSKQPLSVNRDDVIIKIENHLATLGSYVATYTYSYL